MSTSSVSHRFVAFLANVAVESSHIKVLLQLAYMCTLAIAGESGLANRTNRLAALFSSLIINKTYKLIFYFSELSFFPLESNMTACS